MLSFSLSPPFVAFILQPGLRAGAPLGSVVELFLGNDRLSLGGSPLSLGIARSAPSPALES